MKKFMPDAVSVILKEGTTFVMSPNGDILGRLTGVTLVDNHNEVPTVTVTLYCNVVSSELEANQKYKAAKLTKLQAELEKQEKEMAEAALQATRKFKNYELVIITVNEGSGTIEAEGTIKKAWPTRNTEPPYQVETWTYRIDLGADEKREYRLEKDIRKID
jgi:hypothetical protein